MTDPADMLALTFEVGARLVRLAALRSDVAHGGAVVVQESWRPEKPIVMSAAEVAQLDEGRARSVRCSSSRAVTRRRSSMSDSDNPAAVLNEVAVT
jgi:hypothetical protein